ncbi:hypothetical protein P5V15_006607 [Pogonomyrmex californicus]
MRTVFGHTVVLGLASLMRIVVFHQEHCTAIISNSRKFREGNIDVMKVLNGCVKSPSICMQINEEDGQGRTNQIRRTNMEVLVDIKFFLEIGPVLQIRELRSPYVSSKAYIK